MTTKTQYVHLDMQLGLRYLKIFSSFLVLVTIVFSGVGGNDWAIFEEGLMGKFIWNFEKSWPL